MGKTVPRGVATSVMQGREDGDWRATVDKAADAGKADALLGDVTVGGAAAEVVTKPAAVETEAEKPGFSRRHPDKTAILVAEAAAKAAALPDEVYDPATGIMRRPTGRDRKGGFTFERGE